MTNKAENPDVIDTVAEGRREEQMGVNVRDLLLGANDSEGMTAHCHPHFNLPVPLHALPNPSSRASVSYSTLRKLWSKQ
ncbi:hypothetical protein E2C01_036431 [Portunus trituberculatus]|uniref:Uncharacterized protein n=1 Tax=Portunus trituberculatus TaxID=210409 RepID=A0A5B7F5P8_PORTR|nr:hypothetical protein [Portunus trituberculatus]